MKRWVLFGLLTWLGTILAGGAALVLADFGAPAWAFVAPVLWLWTLGLPALLATLVTLAVGGTFPGIGVAAAALGLASLAAQLLAAYALARAAANRRARSAGLVEPRPDVAS
jgi:hypothetical protein